MLSDLSIRERTAQHIGLWVILLLAVLTAIEFVVFAVLDNSTTLIMLLVPIALLKAWMIVSYFMHVSRAWSSEGSH